MDTSKTPPSKRKPRTSLGTAIKRNVQVTRKGPGSAGKKRRVVVATQKNIARALNNDSSESNKIGSSVYEGRITRARNATSKEAAFKETPSRMLRQLSRVLPRPSPERQTPRRNSIRGVKRTPGSIRLTPNSTRRSTKKPNNKNNDIVAMKKQSPQDLLRQLTRAPGFIQAPQDVPVRIGISNTEVESKQEMEIMEQHKQNNVQIRQSIKDDELNELMDIETQLHDKIDYSEDEISNYFDQVTETMEFTGEVITDQNNMGIGFNDQVKIQPPDEIFNKFRNQEFDGSNDNNEVSDAFNSPIAGSSRLQEEGNEFDNFWLGRNLNDLNNLTFENNLNAIENFERRNRLLNELLRSSLDNQVENDLENYSLSHDFLGKQSNERVQLFNSKNYDIENIISLDPLVNETENEHGIQSEGNSKYNIPIINGDANNLEIESTIDDKSYHQPDNDMELIQGSEELPQDESKEIPQDEPEEISQDESEEVPQDEPEEISQDEYEEVSQDESEEMPQDESEEVLQDEPEETQQDEPANEPVFEFDNDLNSEQRLNNNQRNKKIRTRKPTGIARLPNSLIKSLFSKFSAIKVSKEAMQAAFDGTQEYFEQISIDLNTYASHAKREVIQEKDVLLLMKRQGLITEKSTFESLVEQYLPRELSNEICPYARAGNIVYPQKQLPTKRTKKKTK